MNSNDSTGACLILLPLIAPWVFFFFFCPFQKGMKKMDDACSGFADRSENRLTV